MKEIMKTLVIGGGAMGHGIAQVFAQSGCDVVIVDINEEVLSNAKRHVDANLKFLAQHGLVEAVSIGDVLNRIQTEPDISKAPSDIDFIIEAVPEDVELKQKVLSGAEAHCSDDTILATTTSVIQVGDIAEGITKPERFIGAHWMNPPYVLPLVEVIPGPKTSDHVVKRVRSFLEDTCGKRTVTCGDAPGFLVNRMAAAVLVEAAKMVQDGIASFEDIDRAWKEHIGYIFLQFGPFGNIDHIGLDVINMAANYLAFVLEDERFRPPAWLQEKVEAGHLGTKSGKGVYDYGGRSPEDLRIERIEKLLEVIRRREGRIQPSGVAART
ncbi:MAG: 3-hydroxyacyl-CoA dehydrogenase family protein [Promethearchaeota archaeon]